MALASLAQTEAPPVPRVLIVEDEPDARAAMDLLVRRWGCRTACAASVSQALPLLDSADVVLLDLMMPDRNGVELLRLVRELGLAARVAVVTAAQDPALLTEARSLRPEGFFTKPVQWDSLRQWLRAGA